MASGFGWTVHDVGGRGRVRAGRPCVAGRAFHTLLSDGRHQDDRGVAESEDGFNDFRGSLTWIFNAFSQHHEPNEAVTEQELIQPVLQLLGWADYLPQQSASRNEDIPDMLLFGDAASKARAAAQASSADRFEDAVVVEESKRYDRALEGREGGLTSSGSTPHGQILRYLSTADVESSGKVRWGILTNGKVWRLYDHRTRPRSSAYFEVDAAPVLGEFDDEQLRLFYLLFNRKSFTLEGGATTTFIESAIEEGRRYEERVAQDLSNVVFGEVFPTLANALSRDTDASLDEVRHAALIFLYRLLFVLYAEDRGLLPVNDSRYDDYGLRKRVRDDVSERMERQDAFSSSASRYYGHLSDLFGMIDKGDESIGLPPYNGGLFSADAAPLLAGARVPDSVIGPVVYAMSHSRADTTPGGSPKFVNYRDMSVQQLGSIYERLLERELARDEDGGVHVRLNPYARKDSGSFYTPQSLVDLIIDRTLKPLVEERLQAFEKRAEELKADRRPRSQRREELRSLDPATAVLNLKVLDPAMGSGHFLVTAVDFLTDYIVDLIEYVPAVPEWLDGEYASPVVERLEVIQRGIIDRAREANWELDDSQLTDQAVIRRMVLKRCIFGVDKNPLSVELAKVSAVASQLHDGRAAFLPGPPPAARGLAAGAEGCGRGRVVAQTWRAFRVQRDTGLRERGGGDAVHRGAGGRKRGRGARVGRAVWTGRGTHGRAPRVHGLSVRAALDDRRADQAGARGR